MPINLNVNTFEKFSEHKANNANNPETAINLPVDYCKLRPLNEISSTMCEPTPIPTTIPPPVLTTKCIKPVVTSPKFVEGSCAIYRYESPEKIRQTIKDQGYYVFRNMIPKVELNVAKKYFYGNSVNYNKLSDKFIKPIMLKKVSNEIDKNLVNIKFRASNNNNSSDAGGFHRDLHIKSGEERVSCHTVLTYIDGGVMELIPTSNRKQTIDLLDVNQYYNMRKEVTLNPGDVLMFEMATIHRGVFYKKQESRRLIQLFDTVFEEDLDYFLKTILHVPCGDNCSKKTSDYFVKLHKNKFWSNLANSIVYYNTALGYTKLPMKYITKHPDVKYISTETNQPRVIVEDNTFQTDNLYHPNFETLNMSVEDRERFMFLAFLLNHILTFILVIVIIVIVVLTIRIIARS
jgi:hypothetical protein